MRLISAFSAVVLACAVQLAAVADETQKIILKAVERHGSSIVKIEYECKQADGKGAGKFAATGVIVGAEGLVMATGTDEIDPPVGGRYQKPTEYSIIFGKDVKAKAAFLGKDEELNLALLKIKKEDPKPGEKAPEIKPVVMVETKGLDLAQEIIVLDLLSNDPGYKPTFSLRRITAVVEKPAGPPEYIVDDSLQGLAGCPVIDMEGEAVGFVAMSSSSGGGRTVNMGGRTMYFPGGRGAPRILCYRDFKDFLADPSKFLRRKCWLGVRGFQALSKELAEQMGLAGPGGVMLGEILKDSPASKAGLLEGDIVVKIDGEKLEISEDKDLEKFTKAVERAAAGTVKAFVVARKGGQGFSETEIKVAMEEEPTREYEVEESEEKTFGIRIKPLTRDFLDNEKLPMDTDGVRVTQTESAGWAQLAGVRPGDIIKGVVLKKVSNVEEFHKRMKEVIEAKEPEVCFNVIRGGKSLFLCVRPQWGGAAGGGK